MIVLCTSDSKEYLQKLIPNAPSGNGKATICTSKLDDAKQFPSIERAKWYIKAMKHAGYNSWNVWCVTTI